MKPIRGSVAERLLDIRDPDELAMDGPSGGGDATKLLTTWALSLRVMPCNAAIEGKATTAR